MNRQDALITLENMEPDTHTYDVDSVVDYLYEEYGTWDIASIEYPAIHEAMSMYAIQPYGEDYD